MIAKFQFTNSPGGAEQFINHDISGQPFTLPEGPFGYSYEILDNNAGGIFSTGGNGTDEVRSVSQNQNFKVPGANGQLHMVLKGIPHPGPLPIDFDFNVPPLAQVGQTYTGDIVIPGLDPEPNDPYFNVEFFIGIQTEDDIKVMIPEKPFSPNEFGYTTHRSEHPCSRVRTAG